MQVNQDIVDLAEPFIVDANSKRFGEIKRKDTTVTVTIFNGPKFVVGKQVTVYMPTDIEKPISGLCGKIDAKKVTDMKGPRDCTYKDFNLLMGAWIPDLNFCKDQDLLDLKKKAAEFAKTCPKSSSFMNPGDNLGKMHIFYHKCSSLI